MIEFTIHAENIRDLKVQMESILSDLAESASIVSAPLTGEINLIKLGKTDKTVAEPPAWLLEEEKVEEPKIQEPVKEAEEKPQEIDDCRIAYFAARERGISNNQIKTLLTSLGVERISALPKEKRAEFVLRIANLKAE